MNKRNFSLLTSAVSLSLVIASLTGCGNSSPKNAKELLKTASTNFSSVKNYSLNMDTTLSIDGKDQGSLNTTMVTKGTVFQEPEISCQLNSKMDMNMGDESQSIEMTQYVVKEDSDYTMYMNTMDIWTKTPIATTEDLKKMISSPANNLDVFLEKIEDISLADDINLDGIDCYTIKVNLTKEYFDTMLGENNVLSNMGLDSSTLEQSIDSINNVDSLPVNYYVSKDSTQLVGMDVELGSLIKSVLISNGVGSEDKMGDIKMAIKMTVSDFDNATEISLPEEAASATEVQM